MNEEQIFAEAIQLPAEKRDAYLQTACGDDVDLRQRVEQLLEAHEAKDSLLEVAATMDSTTDAVAAGRHPVIGNYKLLHKLGEGGFGVVYMAEQMRPVRRKVALKIVKAERMGDAVATVARFEAERQALAMMDHPNIATVFDGGSIPAGSSLLDEVLGAVERPFFVMELVNGVPITEYCDKNNLSTRERLKLFVSVCLAVQHAHQKGVIHRDLKPSNILVTLHDGVPVVKIIDFGVAKAINQQLTDKTLYTVLGDMIGTPLYMSPEQAERSGLDIDTRSDIYSLGVLLYELLTGTTPLTAKELKEAGLLQIQRCIVESEPPKPSTRLSNSGDELTVIAKHRSVSVDRLHRELQGDLDWIVMKALDKDRQRRYDTAKGFAVDVERYLNDEAISARPPSTLYLLSKVARKYQRPVIAGGVVLASLIVCLLAIGYFYLREKGLLESERAAREQATLAESRASDSLEKVRGLNKKIQSQLESQSLILAFNAFNSGNIERADAYLSEVHPTVGSSEWIPWRFLSKRIADLVPRSIDLGAKVECWDVTSDGSYFAAGLGDGKVVFGSMDGSLRTSISIPISFVDRAHSRFDGIAISPTLDTLSIACRTVDQGTVVRVLAINGKMELKIIDGALSMPQLDGGRDISYIGPSGRLIGSMDYTKDGSAYCKLTVWDTRSGKVHCEVNCADKSWFTGSIDGRLITTYGDDGLVRFFASDGTPLPIEPIDAGNRLEDVDIFPNGTGGHLLAVAGYQGTQLFELSDEKVRFIRQFSWDRGADVEFSIDGQSVAVYSKDTASVSLFDVTSGRLNAKYPESSFDYSDQNTLCFAADKLIRQNGTEIRIVLIPEEGRDFVSSDAGWYSDFACSPTTSLLAYRHGESGLGLWDTARDSQTLIRLDDAGFHSDRGIAISDAGERLASGMSDGTIRVLKATGEVLMKQRRSFGKSLGSLQFSPANSDLLLATVRGGVQLIDIRSPHEAVHLVGESHVGNRISCEFSPSGRFFVVGGMVWGGKSEAYPTLLFEIKDGAGKQVAEIPIANVYRAVIDQQEELIAIIDSDATEIRLWNIADKKFLEPIRVSATRLLSIAFSPDGECLVVTNPAGELIFLDHRQGRELGRFKIHHPLRHVRFFDHGRRIAVSSMDGYLMQWEL